MKKIIKKFWGVAFLLVILSTLFVGAVPQAAAGNFALTATFGTPGNVVIPSTVMAPAAGFGILDVAQSGAVIYAVGDAAGVEYLYKSSDGGVTWVQTATIAAPLASTHGLPSGAGATWGFVAVAADNPDIVVVVNTEPALGDTVWLSTTGGAWFDNLPGVGATANITCVAVSPQLIWRFIAIGGHTIEPAPASGGDMLLHWTIGAVAPAWAAPTNFANIGADDVEALAYSSQFLADQCLMVVTERLGTSVDPDTNGAIGLHVYRYDIADWDQNVDTTYPRYLYRTTGVELQTGRMSIVLDPNFYVGDLSAQIGFIGANITANVSGVIGTQVGGVWRINTYAPVAGNNTLTQIDTGTAINSVAYDGNGNVMAAVWGVPATATSGLVVRRAASAATAPVVTFLPNTAVKTPGTGNATLVLFNLSSGVGLAFSRGQNSAICRTTDYGKSFNGYALVNSVLANPGFGAFRGMWTSGDAATKYFTVGDGVDMNIWRQSGFTWERIFIRAGATAQNWTIAADADNPATVVAALTGGTTMYRSTDSGNTIWDVRAASFAISDVAVQDANTIYVAIAGQPWVLKGTGPFTIWSTLIVPFAAGGGSAYSLNLLADNKLIVGGTAGGVAYTKDGGTTWTGLPNLTWAGGKVVTAASGLEAGDAVYGVGNGGGNVCRWVIGANFLWDLGVPVIGAGSVDGIALTNGVLFVLDPTAAGGTLYRCLHPTILFTVGVGWEGYVGVGTLYTSGINTLSATVAGTTSTIWAINNAAFPGILDPIFNFIDYITSPSNAPVPVYPLAGTEISVNSLNGAVATFIFKWDEPPPFIFPAQAYDYNLQIYLDEAGLVPVAGGAAAAVLAGATTLPNLSISSAAGTVAFTGAAAVAVPGETYYWRVRVDAVTPAESYWSAMQTFTVHQLVAIVPVIASPVNGGEVNTVTPGFSWSPIDGATSYRFELASDADFTDIIYTVDPATAGASVPTDKKLTRGAQYFWHVKTLTPAEGEWSTTANFIVAELPTEQAPPVIVTTAPAPTITAIITQPPATTTQIVIPPAETREVNPSYIWAIIIVGAVLVIAVIILIVRTRRTV